MKSLFALIMLPLISLSPLACGGASKDGRSTPSRSQRADVTRRITTSEPFRSDGDADNPADIDGDAENPLSLTKGEYEDGGDDQDNRTKESLRYPDKDDSRVLNYGRPARSFDKRSIIAVVKRYYAAVSAGTGGTACSLIVPSLARSVHEDYGSGAGPSYLRGGVTCQAVISRLSSHFKNPLADSISITAVRVHGNQAQAVLDSRTMFASHITLRRTHDVWRVAQLLGTPLP